MVAAAGALEMTGGQRAEVERLARSNTAGEQPIADAGTVGMYRAVSPVVLRLTVTFGVPAHQTTRQRTLDRDVRCTCAPRRHNGGGDVPAGVPVPRR